MHLKPITTLTTCFTEIIFEIMLIHEKGKEVCAHECVRVCVYRRCSKETVVRRAT